MLIDIEFHYEPRFVKFSEHFTFAGLPNPEFPDYKDYPKDFFNYQLAVIRHSCGIYEVNTYNFGLMLDLMSPYKAATMRREDVIYGVADNAAQIKSHIAYLKDDPRPFIVAMTPVYKSLQPKQGGWRWHKWGQYIGTKSRQCEYIADEPEIDMVFCFSVIYLDEQ
jgi:hypothetical protein